MKPVAGSSRRTRQSGLPPFENGDRMTQAEFHKLYETCPEKVKAELIGGTVFMASPLRRPHGRFHPVLSGLFWLYENSTPGVELLDNTTAILDEENEVQPDLALRVLPEFGGQTWTDEDEYVFGASELVAEIAHSSKAIDLNKKKEDYEKAGVREYIVLSLKEKRLYWFDFHAKKALAHQQGIYRSRVFPGLWIDGPALLARKSTRLIEVLHRGLASPDHDVRHLKIARRKN